MLTAPNLLFIVVHFPRSVKCLGTHTQTVAFRKTGCIYHIRTATGHMSVKNTCHKHTSYSTAENYSRGVFTAIYTYVLTER